MAEFLTNVGNSISILAQAKAFEIYADVFVTPLLIFMMIFGIPYALWYVFSGRLDK